MFGKIILTAMLTTSSATAEDAGKNIASGLATASTRQIGQAVIPPFFGALKSRGHAACAKRCFGV